MLAYCGTTLVRFHMDTCCCASLVVKLRSADPLRGRQETSGVSCMHCVICKLCLVVFVACV